MKLHAILSWYDEPATWLAGCVASLSRIGVDHVIAVDGRYPHFNIGGENRSRLDQVDAITSAAYGCGMGVTVHQPTEPMLESDKRTLCFRLLNATAAYGDWVIVIDADEMIVGGDASLKRELLEQPADTHVVACRVTNSIDPYAEPSADNDVTAKTLECHQKLPVPAEFAALQSRLWRVLNDMHCRTTHFSYVGTDEAGKVWNLRPDIGKPPEGTWMSDVGRVNTKLTIEHRKNHRTYERRTMKRAYYSLRDESGLERV